MPDPRPGQHREDLPWNDAPADDEAPPGHTEPEPAEVTGDEDDARDLAARRAYDFDQRDTLDERLHAEVPDRIAQAQDPEAPELAGGLAGEDDVEAGERDLSDFDEDDDDLPAEEAAIHVVDDDRI